MAEITREEFEKVYRQQLEPILKDLEVERLENNKKAIKCFILFAIGLIVGIVLICIKIFFLNLSIGIILVSLIISGILAGNIKAGERKKLKRLIVQKILTLYGNLYFSDNKDIISHKEIKDMGLYRCSTNKNTDDVVIGIDKGCNFVIAETELTHSESRGSGDSSRSVTITDFKGLIVKIQMKKNFTGRTIVGMKGDIVKMRGFEKVELESVDFMKNREVYSTDQIEARYILTTAFMERLQNLGANFLKDNITACVDVAAVDNSKLNQSIQTAKILGGKIPTMMSSAVSNYIDTELTGVSAGFVGGYAYLFIPTLNKDFFEVETWHGTLLQPHLYYNIYKEIETILKVIEYLHLDKNTGL